jgi:hypothetical protein
MSTTTRAERSRMSTEMRELTDELDRYKQASEDALQQLDWCIGYFHGCGKKGIAKALSQNRAFIRRSLMNRPDEPTPTQISEE